MARIAVFDSGLGSLSIIKEIQRRSNVEIIYFGDQENFPYGKKSKRELGRIIKKSISMIEENFSPDLIVVGSNTPTIMLDIKGKKVIGVRPPLKQAAKLTKTKNIGILGTKSAIQSAGLSKIIKDSNLDSRIKIHKINGSSFVDLVESGKFLTDIPMCKRIIKRDLQDVLIRKNIDVITLSSTHLPFLKCILEKQFGDVTFIDPASFIAKKIHKKIENIQGKQKRLKIFCSGDVKNFQKNLGKLGIKNKVSFLSI